MKLTIPGILVTALIVASPGAMAQNTEHRKCVNAWRECGEG